MRKIDEKFVKLPESELLVMQIIWEMERRGVTEINATEMFAMFPEKIGHLKLTTVLTLLTRLHGKGFISVEKRGRNNCYSSLISESKYNRAAAADFVATVCGGDAGRLVSALCTGGVIRREDVDKLRRIIEEESH